jgi:site-specific recombinase XerD
MAKRSRNQKQSVRLREKLISGGNKSLYLDIYKDGQRRYEFLKIYVVGSPRTPEERSLYRENYELAEKIRSIRENEIIHNQHGIVSPQSKKINFLDYCDRFLADYPNKDIRIVRYCIEHFKGYVGRDFIYPHEVSQELLIGFKRYLDSKLNGETPYNYFAKMKQIMGKALRDKIIQDNPAESIINRRTEGLKKEILKEDEIRKIAQTHCSNNEIKRAFLLSLNTGLRFVDVLNLKWKNVYDDMIILRSQSKTKKPVYIDLNATAKKLLGDRGEPEKKVFNLPTHTGTLKVLKTWIKNAGMDRNITYHSARHSFAVNLLIKGVDIKTVSSLLGHTSLKHTEKYLHLVDDIKRQAVDVLPDLNFD